MNNFKLEIGDACNISQPDESFDLIIADPPFGIKEKHIAKKLHTVPKLNLVEGYIESPADYQLFSTNIVREIERLLKPTGSAYIVSGWTNSNYIHNAINESNLILKNKIIWKYEFGVYTTRKYVTSHYEIFYIVKKDREQTFNMNCRYENSKESYADRSSVWSITMNKIKKSKHYTNCLPPELVKKMIDYSSNQDDRILDMFCGSMTTSKVAVRNNRNSYAIDLNPNIEVFTEDVVLSDNMPVLFNISS